MLGLGEKSPKKRASQSRPVLGYSAGFIQPPCSRQRMCILVSANDHAMAAPEAPAPMIRTSTGSFIETLSSALAASGAIRPIAACLLRQTIGADWPGSKGWRANVALRAAQTI